MTNRTPLPIWKIALLSTVFGFAGNVQAAELETPARNVISPWGFCSSAEWFGEYPRFNPLMVEAGVRSQRAFPEWQTIQPTPDTWNWKPADDLIANAKTNGMEISGGFWYFAKWATPKGDTRSCPLKDINAWSTYVEKSVERYRDDIRDWEVYNEFNGSFSVSKNKPKDYADLVIAASDAAKKVDPAVRIGMSCANFDLGFFDGAIKAGASGKFDFICVHPYENLGQLVDGGEPGYLSMAASIRKMLADNNQRDDIALWITEFGIQSTVKPHADKDALQADILVKGHVLALAQGFERICWFEARGP
jgi:polysaccharide biosynthesis protein PslG